MEAIEERVEERDERPRMWAEARCALWENWPDLPSAERPAKCTERAQVVFHDTHHDGCRHWLLCPDHANLMQLHMRNDELNQGHVEHAQVIDEAFEPLRVGGCGGC